MSISFSVFSLYIHDLKVCFLLYDNFLCQLIFPNHHILLTLTNRTLYSNCFCLGFPTHQHPIIFPQKSNDKSDFLTHPYYFFKLNKYLYTRDSQADVLCFQNEVLLVSVIHLFCQSHTEILPSFLKFGKHKTTLSVLLSYAL